MSTAWVSACADLAGSCALHQLTQLPFSIRQCISSFRIKLNTMSAVKGAVDMRSCALKGASPALVLKPVCRRAPRRSLQTSNAVKEIFMPALSSTMTEGKIVSWLKGPGDKVSKGESVVVVESDKADMDVESFNDGILGAIVIPEGGVANVGDPIAFIAETADDMEEAKSKAGSGSNGAAPASVEKPSVAEVRSFPHPVTVLSLCKGCTSKVQIKMVNDPVPLAWHFQHARFSMHP